MVDDVTSDFIRDESRFGESAGELLLRLANLYRRIEGAKLRKLGFTRSEYDLLNLLSLVRPGREQRPSDLARLSHLHLVVVTRLLDRLERKGYLLKLADPSDARASRLQLTKEGLEAFKRASLALAKEPSQFFKPLGQEKQGFERLARTLLRFHDPVREAAPSVLRRRAGLEPR